MENTESAIEAEVDLDQQLLRQDRERRGQHAARVAKGGVDTPEEAQDIARHEEDEESPGPFRGGEGDMVRDREGREGGGRKKWWWRRTCGRSGRRWVTYLTYA